MRIHPNYLPFSPPPLSLSLSLSLSRARVHVYAALNSKGVVKPREETRRLILFAQVTSITYAFFSDFGGKAIRFAQGVCIQPIREGASESVRRFPPHFLEARKLTQKELRPRRQQTNPPVFRSDNSIMDSRKTYQNERVLLSTLYSRCKMNEYQTLWL